MGVASDLWRSATKVMAIKTFTFADAPVGIDFRCFGARWHKNSDTTALLWRSNPRKRKKRIFAPNEPVVPVGGFAAVAHLVEPSRQRLSVKRSENANP